MGLRAEGTTNAKAVTRSGRTGSRRSAAAEMDGVCWRNVAGLAGSSPTLGGCSHRTLGTSTSVARPQ
jgi:hypothetical protein